MRQRQGESHPSGNELDAVGPPPRPDPLRRGIPRFEGPLIASQVTGEGTVATVRDLLRLVEKLAREAEKASRTGGRRELDALQATAERYLTLYEQLRARGEIE
jgi:hypothetical protein